MWAYPKCESTFPSKSQSECLSVCPVLFRFQHDILHDMGCKPSKADPDIWMKSSKDGSHYEYIAVYVDDLAICMKDPKAFCDTLKEKIQAQIERSWSNQLSPWLWIYKR